MEMVEERRNQRAIPPKRIRFQEIVEKLEEEVDRISALPDCLLHEILSRLPSTKHAIRTGTLSKRWKHLWTWVHTLDFTNSDDPLTQCPQNPNLSSDFFSFVDKTLTQCRQLKLKEFKLFTSYDLQFESQVNNWIRYAISCNVEELELYICCEEEAEFVLDQFIFTSSCFTDLRLASCMMNPTGAISWTNLRSLCISYVKLDEDLIENILSGSPLLENLVLHDCYGYRRLDITSKSVKNLELCGYCDPEDVYDDLDDIIEINAPNILSLTIRDSLLLWKVLLNVSSLVEANLDFQKLGHYETTHKEAEEEMLKGFIQSLRRVKELNIGYSCARARSRLEAKGFCFPANMKYPDVTYDWSDSDSD